MEKRSDKAKTKWIRGIVSLEYLVLGSIIGVGAISGYGLLQKTYIEEATDLANALLSLDNSYAYTYCEDGGNGGGDPETVSVFDGQRITWGRNNPQGTATRDDPADFEAGTGIFPDGTASQDPGLEIINTASPNFQFGDEIFDFNGNEFTYTVGDPFIPGNQDDGGDPGPYPFVDINGNDVFGGPILFDFLETLPPFDATIGPAGIEIFDVIVNGVTPAGGFDFSDFGTGPYDISTIGGPWDGVRFNFNPQGGNADSLLVSPGDSISFRFNYFTP